MSTVTKADPAGPAGSARHLSERRPLGDISFQALALAAGLLVLVILVLIAVSTSQQASSWFSTEGIKIFSSTWNPTTNQFGALPFIYGTAVTAIIALVMAVPVSVGIALLLTEVVPYRWARPIVYVIDLLAVVPSVVWGLWGILVFAPWIQHYYASVSSGVNGIPVLDSLFGGQTSGASFFTAGIILAFMITPIVTSLSREVIATVPAIDKEGAYALGATRLGDDQRCRLAAQPGRRRRGGAARAGPGHGRDHRGRAGHRLLGHRSRPTCSPRATTCPRSSRTSSARPPGCSGPHSSGWVFSCSRSRSSSTSLPA